MAPAKTLVSAHVICYMNGKPYGKVTGFSWSAETPRRAIYALDSMEPFELMATVTKVAGNINIIRGHGDGGIEGAGMTATFEDLPKERYFSLVLIDRMTDTVIFEASYCSVISQRWEMPSKGAVSGAISFEALDYNNELKNLQ